MYINEAPMRPEWNRRRAVSGSQMIQKPKMARIAGRIRNP